MCFLGGGLAKLVVEAGRSWCLAVGKGSKVVSRQRWVWVCSPEMVEPGICPSPPGIKGVKSADPLTHVGIVSSSALRHM